MPIVIFSGYSSLQEVRLVLLYFHFSTRKVTLPINLNLAKDDMADIPQNLYEAMRN
jgi:hypothetical protein